MKLGVVLPSFRADVGPLFAAAAACEDAGLDGVFLYDHLWPLGEPGKPAVSPFPLLGALAGKTSRIALGTLVARVGLVANDVLLEEICSVDRLSEGRFIAGLGTGDARSAAENRAYGVSFPPSSERLSLLDAIVEQLIELHVPTWVGGRSPSIAALAKRRGVPLNLWAATPDEIAVAAHSCEVTWGGILPRRDEYAAELLSGLQRSGCSWAVIGWPGSIEPVLRAARRATMG